MNFQEKLTNKLVHLFQSILFTFSKWVSKAHGYSTIQYCHGRLLNCQKFQIWHHEYLSDYQALKVPICHKCLLACPQCNSAMRGTPANQFMSYISWKSWGGAKAAGCLLCKSMWFKFHATWKQIVTIIESWSHNDPWPLNNISWSFH